MLVRLLIAASVTFGPLAASQLAAADPVVVRGRVILDKNANGQLDADEKGLAGAAISDGMQFVTTSEDGSFELKTADDPVIPYKPAQVVTLCWGTGYWPTGLWYRRLADIKPGETLLFGLRPDEQKIPFAMVQTTDPHNNFAGADLSQWFREEVGKLGNSVKFAIVTGDLGYAGLDNADAMFSSIQGFARSFPIPMFITPGNHDIVAIHTVDWKKQTELHGSGAYTKYLGPIRWSFDYAGCHFVGLDWVLEENGKLEGGIPPSCVAWIEKDLARLKPGTRIFAFSHAPECPQEAFYDVLRKHKMELFLAGHSHQNLDLSSNGLKMLTTVNLLGKETPFRVLHVHDGGHDVVDRCKGTEPNHRRDCDLCVPGPIPNLRREKVDLPSQTVADKQAVKVGDLRATWIDLETECAAPQAGTCGVRLVCDDAAVKPVEVRFDKDSLISGGLTVPHVRGNPADNYRLHIHVLNGYLQVRANDRVHFERPLPTDKPWRAELIAEGGSATFTKTQLWRLIDNDLQHLEEMAYWHGYGRQQRQVKEYRAVIERIKGGK